MDFLFSIILDFLGQILGRIVFVPFIWIGRFLVWLFLNIFGRKISMERVDEEYQFLPTCLGVLSFLATLFLIIYISNKELKHTPSIITNNERNYHETPREK